MTLEDEWNEELHKALQREAVRRPRSRYAAGVLQIGSVQTDITVEQIDNAIIALVAIRDLLTTGDE